MERHELLERLAPLIPPPRAHQVRYHGVLAPCGRYGLYLGPNSAYLENVITVSTTGTVNGGVNMGSNSCDGSTICP
jgi:hypothetical protein